MTIKRQKSFASWLIHRACLNKRSYSLDEAENMIDLRASQGIEILYYKCSFCNRYHLTKNKELKDTKDFLQII